MPDPITRRQFLQGSAILAGAAIMFDPSWLFAEVIDGQEATDGAFGPNGRGPDRRSEAGIFAQVHYGDGDSTPLVWWTRLGEDHRLELWTDELTIDVPTRSETVMRVPLSEFDEGRGQHEVVQFFGSPTLAQLRTEVGYRAVLVGQYQAT